MVIRDGTPLSAEERLAKIAELIEAVEARARAASEGGIRTLKDEIGWSELRWIYVLATAKRVTTSTKPYPGRIRP